MTLKLNPNPIFDIEVTIPTHEGDVGVMFSFKYRDREALREFGQSHAEAEDIEIMMGIVANWKNVDTPFSREAMAVMIKNYPRSVEAITNAYLTSLAGQRLGN
jgi:hypothetical protein